jgi:hypothetical protein
MCIVVAGQLGVSDAEVDVAGSHGDAAPGRAHLELLLDYVAASPTRFMATSTPR